VSAQLTYEPRSVERHVAYIDRLGYAFCACCYHTASCGPCEPSQDTGACDGCGSSLQHSIEVVDGMALVEHTPARIF
jgi:hypothetical protein